MKSRYGITIPRCVKSQKIADQIIVFISVLVSLPYLVVNRLLPPLVPTLSGYKYGLSILKKEATDVYKRLNLWSRNFTFKF